MASSTARFADPESPQSPLYSNGTSNDYGTGHTLASSPLFREDETYTPSRMRQNSSISSASSSARISRDLDNLRLGLPPRQPRYEEPIEDDNLLEPPDLSAEAAAAPLSTPTRNSIALDSDTEELGSYSALSKKADSILAAAKKRLSLLEGNIKGARHSLSYDANDDVSTPTKYGHLKTASVDENHRLSRSPNVRINFGQPRNSVSLVPDRTQKVHSRNFSETSVPSQMGSVTLGSMPPQFQTPRDLGQVPQITRQLSFKSSRRESVLEPVVEEAPSPTKSSFEEPQTASQTNRPSQLLRTETESVRERLSSIQEGVLQAVDSRRSWQHPTPKVLPEEVATIKEVKALERTLDRQEAVIGQLERSERYDVPKRHSRDAEWGGMRNSSFYDNGDEYMDEDDRSEGDETDYRSVLEELDEPEPDLDAAHEDRADAFDYENFIIHSVFNNATLRPPRSPSADSSNSASTPRANYSDGEDADGDVEDGEDDFADEQTPEEEDSEDPRQALQNMRQHSHQSSRSVDSFETAHTFMNSSGDSSEDDDGEELMGGSAQKSFPMPPSITGSRQASTIFEASEPTTPTADAFRQGTVGSLRTQGGARPASMIFAALVDPLASTRGLPGLDEADQTLVRSLAEAMRFACVQLQRHSSDPEQAAEWRGRLEEAQRVLSGQDEMI